MQVFELDFEHAAIARHLFKGLTYDRVFADSFYEGRQRGRLLVDAAEQPTSAMLCRTYEYFFAGQPVPALLGFLRDAPSETELFATFPSLDVARTGSMLGFYGMVAYSPEWEAAIRATFGDALEVIDRRAFTFPAAAEPAARGWRERVPPGFSVVPVDQSLARRLDVEIDELIGLMWSGYEHYGRHGFGAAILAGEAIASVAYAIATSSTEANIGVGTVEAYQRRGLAALAASACIEQALDRGLRPTWDCDAINPASANLAHKLGFGEEPSFVELAFPDRHGPPMTTGRWRASPHPLGRMWSRVDG